MFTQIIADKIFPDNDESKIGDDKNVFSEIFVGKINFGNGVSLFATSDGRFFSETNGLIKELHHSPDSDAFRINEKGELIVEKMRDVPGDKLSAVFYDKLNNEISFDSFIPPYTELLKIVTELKEEVEKLKNK